MIEAPFCGGWQDSGKAVSIVGFCAPVKRHRGPCSTRVSFVAETTGAALPLQRDRVLAKHGIGAQQGCGFGASNGGDETVERIVVHSGELIKGVDVVGCDRNNL